jgi:hypothetical protein
MELCISYCVSSSYSLFFKQLFLTNLTQYFIHPRFIHQTQFHQTQIFQSSMIHTSIIHQTQNSKRIKNLKIKTYSKNISMQTEIKTSWNYVHHQIFLKKNIQTKISNQFELEFTKFQLAIKSGWWDEMKMEESKWIKKYFFYVVF